VSHATVTTLSLTATTGMFAPGGGEGDDLLGVVGAHDDQPDLGVLELVGPHDGPVGGDGDPHG
jgi:hypothetical protein